MNDRLVVIVSLSLLMNSTGVSHTKTMCGLICAKMNCCLHDQRRRVYAANPEVIATDVPGMQLAPPFVTQWDDGRIFNGTTGFVTFAGSDGSDSIFRLGGSR